MHHAPTELSAVQHVVSIALRVLTVLRVFFVIRLFSSFVLETQLFVAATFKARRLPLRRATTSVIIKSLPEDYLSKAPRKIFRVFVSLYSSSIIHRNNLPVSATNYATAPHQRPDGALNPLLPPSPLRCSHPHLPSLHHAEDYLSRKHDAQTFKPVGCARMPALKSSHQTLPQTMIPAKTVAPAPHLLSSFLPCSFLS
jgi:hypothetical protein